jgi:thiosulfate/3-mercaptopyruvate sulfurtransferase
MSASEPSMQGNALVSAEQLAAALGRPDLAVIDARFGLGDPAQGERDYAAGHIPGAVYAHLDRDLSDHSRHGHGRHPLPDGRDFSARLASWGITPQHQVVVYDARDGTMAAARAWFMLRLLGHRRAAVLDGGFSRWIRLDLPVTAEIPQPATTAYAADYEVSLLTRADALNSLQTGKWMLIDVRAAERFRGEVEPLDRVAGHVPGAINRPLAMNLQPDGRFRDAGELAVEYRALLGEHSPADVVMMCGSGVTACHGLLAMEHAGLAGARLYADSWSGWISDPTRPVEKG